MINKVKFTSIALNLSFPNCNLGKPALPTHRAVVSLSVTMSLKDLGWCKKVLLLIDTCNGISLSGVREPRLGKEQFLSSWKLEMAAVSSTRRTQRRGGAGLWWEMGRTQPAPNRASPPRLCRKQSQPTELLKRAHPNLFRVRPWRCYKSSCLLEVKDKIRTGDRSFNVLQSFLPCA